MTTTDILQGYLDQGYVLPEGWTPDRVDGERAKYAIGKIYVPVASGPGCIAWGVPMIDGRFLSRPEA